MEKECPREPRQHRLFKVEVITGRGKPFNAIVRNISAHGLRAKGDNPVHPGQFVQIRKQGFEPVSGTVRWVRDRDFGLEFDQEIDVEQFSFADRNSEGLLKPKDEKATIRRSVISRNAMKRPGFSNRLKR